MKIKPLLAKILMVFLLILLIFLGVNLVLELTRQKPATTQSTDNESTDPNREATKPLSRWATDSGVISIKTDLKRLSQEGQKLDLKELSLLPPLIDIKLEF